MIRPVDVLIKNDDGDSIMKMSKGCDLACGGCLCMPKMTLEDKEHDKDLGSIQVNCNLCAFIPGTVIPYNMNPSFSIYDAEGDKRFSTKPACCTWPLCCQAICALNIGECNFDFKIDIWDESGDDVVAQLSFVKYCAMPELCGRPYDLMRLKFKTSKLSTKEKAILMGSMLFMDLT
jgi:hypothetical protein